MDTDTDTNWWKIFDERKDLQYFFVQEIGKVGKDTSQFLSGKDLTDYVWKIYTGELINLDEFLV